MDNRYSLGLALVYLGVPLATAIRNVFPSVEIVNILMLISVILLLNYKALLSGRIQINLPFSVVLLIQTYMILYSIYCDAVSTKYLAYHLYIIFLSIALLSHKNMPQFKSFIKYLFYIGIFIVLVVCYQATNGFTELIISYDISGKLWLEEGGDPVSLSRALVVAGVTFLLYKGSSPNGSSFLGILKCVLMAMVIIGLFSFSNRASQIGLLISAIIASTVNRENIGRKKNIGNLLLMIAVTVFAIFLLNTNEYFSDKITNLIDGFTLGWNSLFGDFSIGVDSSAENRYEMRNITKEEYLKNFDLTVFFFGLGYDHRYIDFPALQTFADLGFFVGIGYIFILIFVPLIELLNLRNIENKAVFAIMILGIQSVMDQFYCGVPYYYTSWIPGILILFVKRFRVQKEIQTPLRLNRESNSPSLLRGGPP